MDQKNLQSEKDITTEVLDNLPGLVFRVINDGEWTFAYASQGSQRLLGYKPSELVDIRHLRKMIPIEDQVANRKVLARLSPSNPHYKVVYRVHSHSGNIKWVREEGTGFFSQQGQMLYLDGFMVDVTDQKVREEELLTENHNLKSSIQHRQELDGLIGESRVMLEMYDLIIKAANSNATVVITGESGTGKELASRAIHNLSENSNKPFIAVNCGAIAADLVESEFFGYRKGAFTGALTNRQGLLAAAKDGTLFLDEIGEIPLHMQVKLLRVLDSGEYTPIGDTNVVHSNFRLIVATNRNLEDLVRTNLMRKDFYYRINALRLRTPPLRERDNDILRLADYFLAKYAETGTVPQFSEQERSMLLQYSWPGNVRELQNVISRYLVNGMLDLTGEILSPHNHKLASNNVIENTTRSADATTSAGFDFARDLEQTEKKMILEILEKNRWNVRKSAAQLGISCRTMYRRMKKYNVTR